ncbi:phage holin family protein [Ligilactobacillus sp. WILCCON 0076]|uniref:Phage holin family protein n=1 Tax=Ligilactobacillus ubinensis TaxID=2876789 RepID=A0A9X2FHW1_9LACO|nr:phage holin family protein [Ligilactobacillus ubinensis]MCP0886354.1 phage holin family protein [Ligilactobacillus ubinensis]
MGFWQRVVVNTLIFVALAGFFPSFLHVSTMWVAFIAAVVLGILNMFVKPILVLLSFPITIVTLGFFYLLINAFILELTSAVVGSSFEFASFGAALLISIILSIVNVIITSFLSR